MDIRLPARAGEQEHATVQKWLKAEGDRVAEGEPMVEVDTDKVTEEIVAPCSGVLREIVAFEGDEVKVDAVLAIIEEN